MRGILKFVLKFGLIIGLMVVAVAAFTPAEKPTTPNTPSPQIAPARAKADPTSPGVIGAEEANAKELQRKAVILEKLWQLRNSMKNPDSFKLVDALEMKDGTLCIDYRATNSFNAIVPGRAVITNKNIIATGHDQFVAQGNARCGGKVGNRLNEG
jgi:hypothetical protein